MDVHSAQFFWEAVGAYFGVGAVVALAAISGLIRRVDALAAEAPLRVKLIHSSGLVALWPVVAFKIVQGRKTS